MREKKILFWMNCYGSWAPELRRPVETRGYDQYLDAFVDKTIQHKDRIADIYISGGMYDGNGQSECETTKPELEKRFAHKSLQVDIKTDEDSFTSASIMKKFLRTWKNKHSDTIPMLFCDEARYETNKYTCEYFSKELEINLDPGKVIIPLPREDDHPHSTKEAQAEKLEIMKEKGIEYMERLELDKRKKHIEQRKRRLK